MSPMRMNLSDLTRMQRQWSSMMSHTDTAGDGRLKEVQAFGSNPGALRMLTYVPPSLPAGAPLVVVLHGCTQTAAGYDAGSGWSELAERNGFVVLLPEQGRANNANGCFNWFEPGDVARDRGEVASIRQMIAKCVADHRLDAKRVYVTGLSAGGAMTAALLATYPDVFAGGAVIAGLPFGAAQGVQQALGAMHHCRTLPAKEWGDMVRAASPSGAAVNRPPVSIWHGESDQTVTPGNALASAKQWTDVHGLREVDGIEDHVDGVSHRTWRGADGKVRVELYAVQGLAHGTPISPHGGGEQGVGRAMPYMLEAPISSTWHIARSWNLVGPAVAGARPVTPSAAAPVSSDPLSVITQTLRAAGLFGGRVS